MFKRIIRPLILTGILFGLSVQAAHAVRITKTRLEFNPGTRAQQFHILNNTAIPQTYRINYTYYEMQEDHTVTKFEPENKDQANVPWADDILRIAPKRVTVPAGGSQIVRVVVRPKKDMEKKEYRSHLLITRENPPPDFGDKDKPGGMAAIIQIEQAIAIPAIVRMGDLSAEVKITDAVVEKTQDGYLDYSFTVHRAGNRSVYGDFDFVCKDNSEDLIIGHYMGVAVYTEIDKMAVNYKTQQKNPDATNCQNIEIVYRANTEEPRYKGAILATAHVTQD